MERMGKISTSQMFSVLFLCRIISLFTFMLPSAGYLPSGDRIITAIPVVIFEFFYCFIIFFTLKRNNYQGIIADTKSISEGLSKVICIIYTIAFIWFAGIGTARFELFISTVMFPNSELYLMIIILLAASFYASLKGLEAVARASSILFVILGISIIFILFSVMEDFEFYNLRPVLTEGISPLLSFSFYVSVRAAELLSIYVNAPYINGNIKRMSYFWVASFVSISTVILVFLSGVTGEFGNDQIFPLYTLTVIAKIGIFERLDDILTGVWVLCSFIQLSYLLITGMNLIKQGFGKAKKIPAGLILSAGIFTVYLFTSKTVAVFSEAVSSRAVDISFIFLMIIIPLAVTFVNNTKKRRKSG